MKTKYIITGTLALMAALSVQSQSSGAAGAGSTGQGTATEQGTGGANQNLPPGLQNRQQLPPGLQNREQLPPGLAKRTNTLNQAGTEVRTDPSTGAGYGLNPTNAGATVGSASNAWSSTTNRWGAATNLLNTNRYVGTATNSTGLLPTGQNTNRLYGTNTSSTTTTRTMTRDMAYTQQDRTLLVTLRQQVQPVLQSLTTTTTTSTTATVPGAVLEPVHFVVREGVITLVGFVPTVDHRQQIVAAVQQVPGVVRVVDQLEVRTDTTATGGTVDVQESTTGAGTSTPGSIHSTQTSAPSATSSTNDLSPSGTTTTTGTTNLVPPASRTDRRTGLSLTNMSGAEQPPANTGAVLPATSDRTNGSSVYSTNRGLPPGLQKRDELPPGLQKRDELPPGLRNRTNSTPESPNER
jgi:hypothetical protein